MSVSSSPVPPSHPALPGRRSLRYALIRRLMLAGLSWILILAPDAVAAQGAPPLVRLQLQWLHQAQFAGFYLADTLGFYDREGIRVEFIAGGPPAPDAPAIDPLRALAADEADVAVAWLSNALAARRRGDAVVHIKQILKRPGTAMVCHRVAGIRGPADMEGATIGVWNVGDQHAVVDWLQRNGISPAGVNFVDQRPDARDFLTRAVDCATVMTYNEYPRLIGLGINPADLFIVRFADEPSGFLEDGLYVAEEKLADPEMRDRLARFIRASVAGWRYARDHPEEALAVTLIRMPLLDRDHQRRMLDGVLALAEPHVPGFGLLDLAAFERSLNVLGAVDPARTAAAAAGSWTHRIWSEAHGDTRASQHLTPAVRHHLNKSVSAPWFYTLTIIGTMVFAMSGFMRAVQHRYDIWGAFMLAMMPAVGGATLRDLLVGGDRHPLFIFRDPTYITIVVAVVLVGLGLTRFLSEGAEKSRLFNATRVVCDTIGLAAVTVIGARVALIAELDWYWIPICAGISSAGGGMLLDIVTGREPRTFQGEPYEEIAVAGGLLMFVLLLIANRYEHAEWMVTGAIITTMAFVFTVRIAVVYYGLRSPRLNYSGKAAD